MRSTAFIFSIVIIGLALGRCGQPATEQNTGASNTATTPSQNPAPPAATTTPPTTPPWLPPPASRQPAAPPSDCGPDDCSSRYIFEDAKECQIHLLKRGDAPPSAFDPTKVVQSATFCVGRLQDKSFRPEWGYAGPFYQDVFIDIKLRLSEYRLKTDDTVYLELSLAKGAADHQITEPQVYHASESALTEGTTLGGEFTYRVSCDHAYACSL